uniref:Uncharacterized protein n=1 Tax=Timema shepardi TaxID=629360 RepID=A0A7R9BC43_TIMSH|nr:unnamed protein product [Timema shepardi]
MLVICLFSDQPLQSPGSLYRPVMLVICLFSDQPLQSPGSLYRPVMGLLQTVLLRASPARIKATRARPVTVTDLWGRNNY